MPTNRLLFCLRSILINLKLHIFSFLLIQFGELARLENVNPCLVEKIMGLKSDARNFIAQEEGIRFPRNSRVENQKKKQHQMSEEEEEGEEVRESLVLLEKVKWEITNFDTLTSENYWPLEESPSLAKLKTISRLLLLKDWEWLPPLVEPMEEYWLKRKMLYNTFDIKLVDVLVYCQKAQK